MYLSGPQIKVLVDALSKAYKPNRFDQLLLGRLNKDRELISMGPSFIDILYAVVDLANREGWVLPLLDAARASNPNNPHLIAFEAALDRGVIPAAEKPQFEKIVKDRYGWDDVDSFHKKLGMLASWVCAFEIPGSGGTGVLVGPDLVLTNYHVIESLLPVSGQVSPANVNCRFDYKALPDGSGVNPGRAVSLAEGLDWDVLHSPYSVADTQTHGGQWSPGELDFALVRVAENVGEQPIGDNPEPQAPIRGWLRLPGAPSDLVTDDVLVILQHPQDLEAAGAQLQPMKLALGTVMGFVGNGLRVRHNARTLPGSSGSPIFNAKLEITALHHAGEPNNRLDYTGEYNQGIPLGEIVRLMKEKGHEGILQS